MFQQLISVLVHLPVCAKHRSRGLPQPRRRAWSRRRRARSGGVSHTSKREIPPAFPDRPSRGLHPRTSLRPLPYPILRRLSSTSQRRAAPRSAVLPDTVTSRSITACGAFRAPPHAPRPVGRRRDTKRLGPLGVSRCPGAAVRLWIRWGVAPRRDGQPRLVPGLHPPSEDRYRGKVVLP